jgi:hypothetical protein
LAETAQTMTEFTYAPGEKDIIGDRFSPSVVIFWLKTSIAASSTRIQYKAPNTLFGLIPLGASTKTIPLRNIAAVDTNTKFNLGSFLWGMVFLFIGFGMFSSSMAAGVICLIIAVANLANMMSATPDVPRPVRRGEHHHGEHPRKGQAHGFRAGGSGSRVRGRRPAAA